MILIFSDVKEHAEAVMAFNPNSKSSDSGSGADWKSKFLLIGSPLFIFLFFVLASLSTEHNLLAIVVLTHFLLNLSQCLIQISNLAAQVALVVGGAGMLVNVLGGGVTVRSQSSSLVVGRQY